MREGRREESSEGKKDSFLNALEIELQKTSKAKSQQNQHSLNESIPAEII